MSAPKTNIDRQVARHRGPLFGMMAVGGFVAVLLFGWLLYESSGSTDATETPPADAEAPATTDPATADPAPAETAPAETAPVEAAPAETAPAETAPADPAVTTPATQP